MFNTLEEIKTYCEIKFSKSPPLCIKDSQIAQAQVPPRRTYQLIINALPPLRVLDHVKELNDIKEKAEQSGFEAKVQTGKISGGGHHLELTIEDKRQPKFALGESVLFQANAAGVKSKFRVSSHKWNSVIREYEYAISVEDGSVGFKTVSESNLDKIP